MGLEDAYSDGHGVTVGTSCRRPSRYEGFRLNLAGTRLSPRFAKLFLLAACAFFSLLPDADAVFGIVFSSFSNLGSYHNNLSHSLLVGILVAAVGGMIFPVLTGARYRYGFLFALVCYEIHVLLDYVTVGRGVMAFWPLTDARFQSPVKLFFGLHWSQPLNFAAHAQTIVNELAFALALYLSVPAVAAPGGANTSRV